MRLVIGTLALLLGLFIYALLAMRLAIAVLPDDLVIQTIYYAVVGVAWVWPAARVTRWMQQRAP
jgi:hypothetical protein